jgi:predicted 3-demethylubiquinone-9 3-methyltransferase (glyoxalase superfamily)
MNQKITTFLTFDTGADDALKLYTSTFKNSRVLSTQRYASDAPGAKKGEFMRHIWGAGGPMTHVPKRRLSSGRRTSRDQGGLDG